MKYLSIIPALVVVYTSYRINWLGKLRQQPIRDLLHLKWFLSHDSSFNEAMHCAVHAWIVIVLGWEWSLGFLVFSEQILDRQFWRNPLEDWKDMLIDVLTRGMGIVCGIFLTMKG